MKEEPKSLPAIKCDALGRKGTALLPLEKLKKNSPRGVSYEKEIHDFLLTNFNGYTVCSGNISGHWKDDSGKDHYGEHREYRVAIPTVEIEQFFRAYLAGLAAEIEEECIYLELGSELYLVYRN